MPALISNAHEKDAFHDMVDALREKLGPSSGISCDDVDPQELLDIMKSYDSEESEWQKYVHIQSGTHYTRNLVDNCNGKSNLVSPVLPPIDTVLTQIS
jgi:cysteine dioxygenase